ncbi:uncharacterized protein MONBRDRAFT_12666 [Monosiga brevicollis MX1]|uniref:PCI domain-containing protein n=1 Tax=Monosiga brevicollis TaxID=81824 RepID=A9VCY7_MONBE|nr:uncharacterized protein MONBRDRAFT_12666 [Monosiga brevicollis MX1]EDQ84550.1 predicted protein [Monosiga brevicollis MX1]|eukprot:XP_001750577.1 hypothetical protein [Monosiga brevicollis MX1]
MEARMDVDAEDELEHQAHHEAQTLVDPEGAMQALRDAIAQPLDRSVSGAIKKRDKDITELSQLYSKYDKAAEMRQLIDDVRPFLEVISKAKGGKVFKNLIDRFVELKSATPDEKVNMCKDCIAWAQENKRTFLRQALEVRLIALHLDAKQYQECLAELQPLVRELKRLDDRQLLVEVMLMESQALFALSNYPKARASLVSARTTANTIYCPPKMQAALDLQSGILHAQEGDYKTAYSYFYEAFEGYDSVDMPANALRGLKYMLLSKVLLKDAADVPAIVTGKLALKYSGRDIEAMQAVAAADLKRSVANFERALKDYPSELQDDMVVQGHVHDLWDSLLQSNLARIVEPFSRVEITHVAETINLSVADVEKKLSQMILDGQLHGILDQGTGCLEIFEPETKDET